MNFGKFDIVLLTTMSLSIIIMSFTFPAVGLADASNETAADDIPEFNISSSEWDIVGDFPDEQTTPNSGTLFRNESLTVIGEHISWIDIPKSDGVSIELTNLSGTMNVNFINWSGGNAVAQDLYAINSEGQEIRHKNESWSILFDVTRFENDGQPNMTAEVEWEILDSPRDDGGGLLSSLPVIGGLWNAAKEIPATLAYIGSIIIWAVGTVFEVVVTLVTILVSVMVYGVDLIQFLFNSYLDVVRAADVVWAEVVLLVPAILLFTEFAKLGMIGIKLLPQT